MNQIGNVQELQDMELYVAGNSGTLPYAMSEYLQEGLGIRMKEESGQWRINTTEETLLWNGIMRMQDLQKAQLDTK